MPFTYFTEDELRALPDLDDPDSPYYTPERLEDAHDWIVGIVERECETSFVVSTATERLTGTGWESLRISQPYVRSITAMTVDGIVYTGDQIAAVYLEHGYIYAPTGTYWSDATRGNVTVTYTYGWSTEPPADLKQAMLRAARQWAMTTTAWSGADSRATAINNEWGNIQLTVANIDHPTGLPDVDATIMSWARKVRVPKVR